MFKWYLTWSELIQVSLSFVDVSCCGLGKNIQTECTPCATALPYEGGDIRVIKFDQSRQFWVQTNHQTTWWVCLYHQVNACWLFSLVLLKSHQENITKFGNISCQSFDKNFNLSLRPATLLLRNSTLFVCSYSVLKTPCSIRIHLSTF